jgi:hypothetical protein
VYRDHARLMTVRPTIAAAETTRIGFMGTSGSTVRTRAYHVVFIIMKTELIFLVVYLPEGLRILTFRPVRKPGDQTMRSL